MVGTLIFNLFVLTATHLRVRSTQIQTIMINKPRPLDWRLLTNQIHLRGLVSAIDRYEPFSPIRNKYTGVTNFSEQCCHFVNFTITVANVSSFIRFWK